ncbi:hypothetical protein KBI23_23375 [bacterium]|nr:hypothetical protein [bacterium]MBP9809761.1 hypothetical protein [bacterium]
MNNSNELIGFMSCIFVAMALLVVLIFQQSTVKTKAERGVPFALAGFCLAIIVISDLLLCLAGVIALIWGPISAMMPNHSVTHGVSITAAGVLALAVSLYIAKLVGKFWTHARNWAQTPHSG